MPRQSTSDRSFTRRTPLAARPMVASRRGGNYAVEFDVRTAFDFVLSAGVWGGREEELLPEDRRWLADARRTAADAVADATIFGTADTHGWVGELCYLLAQHKEARTASDVVELVDAAPDADVIRALFKELLGDEALRPSLDRILGGDASALPDFESAWQACHGDMPLEAALRDPAAAIAHLRTGLHAWLEPFEQIEERVGRITAHDAERRAGDLASLPAAEAIEQTTGGLRWLPEPQVQRVVLAPSYFGRPYNWLFGSADWRLIVYPIADESLDAIDRLAPPHAAVRLYRALGDDTRLRILRMLVDGDLYLTEIAQRLELSKPTVKHHLTQLRSAGLVTVTEEGGMTYYSLRRNRVAEAGPELARFLGI